MDRAPSPRAVHAGRLTFYLNTGRFSHLHAHVSDIFRLEARRHGGGAREQVLCSCGQAVHRAAPEALPDGPSSIIVHKEMDRPTGAYKMEFRASHGVQLYVDMKD